jgi:uncharacterized protein (TIGR03435 family)
MKPCSRFALLCALTITAAQAQTATPPLAANEHPSFEVATIKPHDPNNQRGGWNIDGRRVSIEGRSVLAMIMFAYALHPKQIVDGPAWITEPYDVNGIADLPGEPTHDQMREMLQKLLADRFALKVHREQRELPAYTITIAKGGPKLQPSKDPSGPTDQDAHGSPQGLNMRWLNASIGDLALTMNFFLDRPVVDRTGLTGKYDFTIQCLLKPRDKPNPDDFPDFFSAVQDQLGLKFNAVKDKVEVLVIDHLDRPSAN